MDFTYRTKYNVLQLQGTLWNLIIFLKIAFGIEYYSRIHYDLFKYFREFVGQVIKLDNTFIHSLPLPFPIIYCWFLTFQDENELFQ